MKIIACSFVLVYPTCSAGQAKTVANLEVFIAVNDVLLMVKGFHCSLDGEQLIVTMQ